MELIKTVLSPELVNAFKKRKKKTFYVLQLIKFFKNAPYNQELICDLIIIIGHCFNGGRP